jgi:CRP-like cAMP-binding protein
MMSAAALFADVPADAARALARVAELVEFSDGDRIYESGERATKIYVIVDGAVRLEAPGVTRIDLAEGEVFGEAAVLENTVRDHDATAPRTLTALEIPKERLDDVVREHPAVGGVLFELLVRRTVTTVVQTAPIFQAFDLITRHDIARMFEVRRAMAGTVLAERGKRSDGLYLVLLGGIEAEGPEGREVLPPGRPFGQESLLGTGPSPLTMRCVDESVVLRLPVSRFGVFVTQFPPAIAHLMSD